MEAVIFWYPVYRVSALLKFATAVVSWAVVFALAWVTPRVLHFPSLAATNERLTTEVEQRMEKERELQGLQARYEALLAGTRSIVWTCDTAGNFVTPQTSWQRFTGQEWEQHQGLGWLNAIHEQDRQVVLAAWNDSCLATITFPCQRQLGFPVFDGW